jgi:glycerol-3-phosphate dehydrogenase
VGNRDAVTVVSPLDGRVMFVLPSGVHTIIGTTERPMHGSPDQVRPTVPEVEYLIRNVNAIFPHAALKMDDVIAAWAGVRPLAAVRSGESNANAASREHAVSVRADGLVSVTGGKLTTFRSMAADVLHTAIKSASQAGALDALVVSPEVSARTPLHGGEFVSLEALIHEVVETVHDHAVSERLATAYGCNWRNVWSYAQRDHSLAARLVENLPYIHAEIAHAVEREMVCTFADLLIRRTHIAFETRDHGVAVARRISALMSALLGWTENETASQLESYEADVKRIFSIDP